MRQHVRWERMAMIGLVILLMIGVIPPQQAKAGGYVARNITTQTNYTTPQKALDEAQDGQTIQLLDNYDFGSAYQFNKPNAHVTLDLNGFFIGFTPLELPQFYSLNSVFNITEGTLNIEDTSVNQTGHIKMYPSIPFPGPGYNSSAIVTIAANGTLNLKSGTLIANGRGITAYENGAHFNISGGWLYTSSQDQKPITALADVYGSISGGYIAAYNSTIPAIETTVPMNKQNWNITGGYFTSDKYMDSTILYPLSDVVKRFKVDQMINPEVLSLPIKGTPLFFLYMVVPFPAATTPASTLDVMNETVGSLTPNAAYTINGVSYTADTNGTIPLDASWIGTTTSIIAPGQAGVSSDSAPQLLPIPARSSAPAVTADDTTDQIIGITNLMEYSIDGGNWTAYSNASSLQLSGNHTVLVRYAAVDSPTSIALHSQETTLTFTTSATSPVAGYRVVGKVLDSTGRLSTAIAGASVQLYQGNTAVGSAVVTDVQGAFTISGVSNGAYNLVITKNGQTVNSHRVATYLVVVNNADYVFSAPLVMPITSTNSQVQISGTNTPNVAVGGLHNLFDDTQYSFLPDDQQLLNTGGKVDISLLVQQTNAATAPGASELTALANGQAINMYLDMSIVKTRTTAANQASTSTIPQVGSLLQLVVPYDMTGKTNVKVYRYHNGQAQVLTALPYSTTAPAGEGFMLNQASKQVIIWSQNFSTYAIASDTQTSTTPTSVVSGGGGGSVGTGATLPRSFGFTVTPATGGSVSPSSLLNVLTGSNQTITITPDAGYVIQNVLIDGKSIGAVSTYTFTNVAAAHTIQAVFAKAPATQATNPEQPSSQGLPYYLEGSQKVWIGFATEINGQMKYIAPAGKEILFQPSTASFSDVTNHWAAVPVRFVADRDLLLGTGDGKFAPNQGMTRAMFAAVLGRLYERSYGKLEVKGKSAFTDVKAGSWYSTYVNWAAQNGILTGMSSSTFEPNRTMTREEMAAMLYRFASFMKLNLTVDNTHKLTYKDAGSIAAWAKPAVTFFAQKDIIHGRSTTQFAPNETATRAETAAVVERFVEWVVAQSAQ